MKNIIIILLSVIALSSCDEVIELDIQQAEPRLIIEALVTNQPGRQYVQLTRTIPFGAKEKVPTVSGASVSVSDAYGQVMDYTESTPGYYVPAEAFVGTPGMTYTLHVEVDGQTYTAEEVMQDVPPLDSLSVREDPEEKADPEEEGRFYEVLIYGKEPQETENFYLFKFYRNDTLFTNDGSWIFAYDDTILGGNIQALPTPLYYAASDKARLEMYPITRQAYRYYLDLSSNINNDGGMFSGQPANVRTNIEGGALGYFQASVLHVLETEVNP